MKISVAMATYNGSRYLQEQLDSIASQILPPYELVICDDGSSDNTMDIVNKFSVNAPFSVRIYQNEANLGFADNFLHVASLCEGDWISFCDQDDVWMPEKISTINQFIEDYDSDSLVMVYHKAELVDENLESTGRRLPKFLFNKVSEINSQYGYWFIGGCVMTFRSQILSDVNSKFRPRDNYRNEKNLSKEDFTKMPHDKWVCILSNVVGKVARITNVLSLYRRHSTASTGSHRKQSAIVKVSKSSNVGGDEYRFQKIVAQDVATSLRKIGLDVSDNVKKNKLFSGACLFDDMAFIFDERSRLYEANSIYFKLDKIYSMMRSKAYFGSEFCSLGMLSFFKDLFYSVGIIGRH